MHVLWCYPGSEMSNYFSLLRIVPFLITSVSLGNDAEQDVTLKKISGEVCFGNRVELLCTHPDPFADPNNYFPHSIEWAENGTIIDFTNPRLNNTRVNSTSSILSFEITDSEEVYRDEVILYTCFLIRNNANRDRQESEAIVIDPEKPNAPYIITRPSNTSNLTKWTHHDNSSCYGGHNFTFILTWKKTDGPPGESSSGSNMTTETQYDFSSLPRGEYSVSIQAQCIKDPTVVSDVVNIRICLAAPAPVSSPGTATTPTDSPIYLTVLVVIPIGIIVIVIAIHIVCCIYIGMKWDHLVHTKGPCIRWE